ncbi:MAG: phospho-N-acetylmuramoyl-pentapeptide-transferase [Bacteroides sp.]
MFYQLYLLFEGWDIPGLGLLQYLSFRAGMAFLVSLLLLIPFGHRVIRLLQRNQIGEEIRDLGLEGQMSKKGTPTMGGLLIVAATLLPTLLFANLSNAYLLIMLVSTLWLGFLGGLDDYIKVFKHKKAGLNGWCKVAGQVALGLFVALVLFLSSETGVRPQPKAELLQPAIVADAPQSEPEIEAEESSVQQTPLPPLDKALTTTIPFFKNNELDYRWLVPFSGTLGDVVAWLLFALIVVLIVTSVSNGANLTDGLDGLAAGVSVPIVAVLGLFAYLSGNVIYASYLNIEHIPNVGELLVYMGALVGALVGFLWYNGYPARIFMGDTGSLTIGGVIGVFAVLVRKELLLPILCGIFLIESLSVMLQVLYFKYTRIRFGEGRRIFLMSPLHHHYQKKGVPEPRIVLRFWIVSLLLAVLTIVTLKVR